MPRALLDRAAASGQVRLLNRIVARFHADPLWFETPQRDSWRLFWKGSVYSRLTTYAMKPRWDYWGKQLVHELSSPADRKMVKLPGWAYPLIRPFGWIVRRIRAN
jgi:hypothetical protein